MGGAAGGLGQSDARAQARPRAARAGDDDAAADAAAPAAGRRGPNVALTRGRTADNVVLAGCFVDDVTALYGGTRLGRQELDGELIEDVEGALWTRAMIERGGRLERRRRRVRLRGERSLDARRDRGRSAGERRRRRVRDRGLRARARRDRLCARRPLGVAGFRPRAGRGRWCARPRTGARTGWWSRPTRAARWSRACCAAVDSALPVRPVRARYGKGRRAEPVSRLVRARQGEVRRARFPSSRTSSAG